MNRKRLDDVRLALSIAASLITIVHFLRDERERRRRTRRGSSL